MKTVNIFENEMLGKFIRWNLKFKINQKHAFHIFKPKNLKDCLSVFKKVQNLGWNCYHFGPLINFVKYNQGFWGKGC